MISLSGNLFNEKQNPVLQAEVEEEGKLDESQAAHAEEKRQVSARRDQSFDEAVNQLALVDDFRLRHRPRDAGVVEPEHCVRRLH